MATSSSSADMNNNRYSSSSPVPPAAPPLPSMEPRRIGKTVGGATTPIRPSPPPPSSSSSSPLASFLSQLWANSSSPSRASNASSSMGGKPFCRICHDGQVKDDQLISPCKCSGSMAKVHRHCLERWLSTPPPADANDAAASSFAVNGGARACELCGFDFSVETRSRPFKQWLLARPFSDDQRNILSDAVCFLLLTPMAVGAAYLCILGGSYYYDTSRVEGIGLIMLASFLLVIYFLWIGICVRYHYTTWKGWESTNQEVRLVDRSEIGGELEDVKIEK